MAVITVMEFEYEPDHPGEVRVFERTTGPGSLRRLKARIELTPKQARQLGIAIDRVLGPIMEQANR